MSKREINRLRAMTVSDMSDDELDADFANVMDTLIQAVGAKDTGYTVLLARRSAELWPEITRRDDEYVRRESMNGKDVT